MRSFLRGSVSTTFTVCALLMLLLQFMSAWAGAAVRSSSPGSDLVYASFREITELNPFLCNDSPSRTVTSMIYQGLLAYGPDMKLEPCLAVAWTISPDNRTVTLELAENVKWQDSKPFTSADVVYSIETAKSHKARATYYNDFKLVEQVRASGPYRVVITWSRAFAPALGSLTMPIIPAHIPYESLSTNPVGTGPFRVTAPLDARSPQQNGSVPFILQSVSDYHGYPAEIKPGTATYSALRPAVNRVILHSSRDQNNLLSLLLAGAVDVAELNYRQYDSVRRSKGFDQRFQVLSAEKLHYTFMAFNLKKEPFSIPEFRKAVALTLDREAMVRDVLRGYGKIVTGPFPGISWASDPGVEAYPHSLDQAKKELTSAGFTWDEKGRLIFRGAAVTMDLLTNKGETAREETAALVAKQLDRIGIQVRVDTLDWKPLVRKHINRQDFDALIMGWSLDPDPDCYSIWHSSQMEAGKMNFTGYSNPRVDTLLEMGRSTFDQARRGEIYREIHRILHQDLPYVFLYSPLDMTAVSRKFTNLPSSPLGIMKYISRWDLAR